MNKEVVKQQLLERMENIEPKLIRNSSASEESVDLDPDDAFEMAWIIDETRKLFYEGVYDD